MNEDFVSFSLAMKLKEKGFREEVNAYYGKWENLFDVHPALDMNDCDYRASAPTISQVLKWLREEKDVDLVIYPIFIYKADDKAKEYHCKIYAPQLNKPVPTDEYRNRYESAALDGIKYVLDNLI